MDSIQPGSTVTVKIVKTPTNAAARKTLVRLLSKDEAHKAELSRRSKVRKTGYNPQPRGGRLYSGHVVFGSKPIRGDVGEQGSLRATVDVISDLRSVQRFVEVNAA